MLLISERNQKVTMTLRVLRIIRLIRIVKLYKAAIVAYKNYESKKRKTRLKQRKIEKEREQQLKKNNEDNRRLEKKKTTKKFNKSSSLMIAPIDVGAGERTLNLREIRTNHNNTERSLTVLKEFQQNALDVMKDQYAESQISRVVSESITQKVIIIILLMLFVSPLTDDDVYTSDVNMSYLILCKFINNIWAMHQFIPMEYNSTILEYITRGSDDLFPIIKILYNTTEVWRNNTIDHDYAWRIDELALSFSKDGLTSVEYSTKNLNNITLGLNLARTVFVIIVLMYMAYILQSDSNNLILKPLDAMINLVDSVAKDPINYKKIELLKQRVKNSIDRIKSRTRQSNASATWTKNIPTLEVEGAEYEIEIIQLAIIRITALLAIGFGEAGGEILRENISSQEGLNPMLPGKKITAIFGFCDIRGFPTINVALQEKTMVFVNEIADIVHSSVNKYGGATNKNIGDAFLLAWKFNHLEKENNEFIPLEEGDAKLNSFMADQAVLAFLNIIKRINRSPVINSYRENADLREKFGDNFKINMGFGLHLGWGIEGAIGSFYKIDCSYLSPNVNIAARLEGATRQYGVTILISGQLYDLLSQHIQNLCLLIDVVTLKGCASPVRLYTIYVNHELKLGKDRASNLNMKDRRRFYSNKKQKLKEKIEETGSISHAVLHKRGFRNLLKDQRRSDIFYNYFREGVDAYRKGDWKLAYSNLRKAKFLDENDGPTNNLFDYILSKHKKAPEGWKGFRELTSK
jgi:class 3 adenylate cyclase